MEIEFETGPNQKGFIDELRTTIIPQGEHRLTKLRLGVNPDDVLTISDIAGACCLGVHAWTTNQLRVMSNHNEFECPVIEYGENSESEYATVATVKDLRLFDRLGQTNQALKSNKIHELRCFVSYLAKIDYQDYGCSLSLLNDVWKLTFEEIALVLETFPECYFYEPA